MDAQDFYKQFDLALDEAAQSFTVDQTYDSDDGIPAPAKINNILDSMFRKDEVLSGAVTTKVDAVTNAGFRWNVSNERNFKKARDLLTEELERQIYFNLFFYGNAFVEIERNNAGNPVGFHLVETHSIRPVDMEGHGEIDYYKQRINGEEITIPEQDIYHFQMDRISSSVWAEIPVRPLAKGIAVKHHVKNHLHKLFKQQMFRPVMQYPEGVDEDEVKLGISYFKETLRDPDKPFVSFGGVEYAQMMDFENAEDFNSLIHLIDNATLIRMQVPPIMAGLPDNSGRSSGEQQTYKAFNTHIRGSMRLIADGWKGLFEKAGLTGVERVPKPLDGKSETDVIDLAVKLKALGANRNKLVEFMQKQGVDIDDDFFDEDLYSGNPDNNVETNATAPSRDGKNDGEMNERVGTGSEGTTRRDQIDEAAVKYQILDESLIERAKRLAQ